MAVEPWAWAALVGAILAMLAVDLFVFHRRPHHVSIREAAAWSVVWFALGMGFGAIVWAWLGPDAAGQYFAGYLIERSLSIDNLFVFAIVLAHFRVPTEYQHRVLFLGVVGALASRAVFIAAGVQLLETFHWMVYVFGAFLVITGVRMARPRDESAEIGRSRIARATARVVPSTTRYDGQRLLTREAGRRVATPLLIVLIIIEATDVVFAVDSIPAVFAVTNDPFLVFASNAFAILGLRALYFLLADMLERFAYLKYALAAILVLVGAKMLLGDVVEVPTWASLAVIAIAIAIGIAASLLRPPKTTARREPAASDREAAGAVPASVGERPPLERGRPPMAN